MKRKRKRVDHRIAWPPPSTPEKPVVQRMQQRRDGEPIVERLTRWGNDNTLSCNSVIKCCDCGLVHNHTYNVVRSNKQFYLIKRAYRVPR